MATRMVRLASKSHLHHFQEFEVVKGMAEFVLTRGVNQWCCTSKIINVGLRGSVLDFPYQIPRRFFWQERKINWWEDKKIMAGTKKIMAGIFFQALVRKNKFVLFNFELVQFQIRSFLDESVRLTLFSPIKNLSNQENGFQRFFGYFNPTGTLIILIQLTIVTLFPPCGNSIPMWPLLNFKLQYLHKAGGRERERERAREPTMRERARTIDNNSPPLRLQAMTTTMRAKEGGDKERTASKLTITRASAACNNREGGLGGGGQRIEKMKDK